jgi:hypothetical protein
MKAQTNNMREDGLYAMTIDRCDLARCLGGPFTDIDDVLDACFDEMMARDCGPSAVFYIERLDGKQTARRFPQGAFQTDEDLGDARGNAVGQSL